MKKVHYHDISIGECIALERQRIEVYTASFNDQDTQDTILDQEIRQALGRDEFFVVYQPIVDILSRKVLSWEALLRWRHPHRGAVSPADFIPVTERKGSILEITRFVIGEVCRQLAATSRICQPEPVSVNVSAVVLAFDFLPEFIDNCLVMHGVPPALLQIQITETAILEHSAHLDQQLLKLRDMGLRVILDDFGTGYSSLMHLWKLPMDGVKIDGSFVQALTESNRPRSIISAIAGVARELGYTVVAECVETETQATWLSQFDGMRGQGFLFSKPGLNLSRRHCGSRSPG